MSEASPSPGRAPNFLGIGMQKTGTTWLYENLRRHPEVFLPPRKELRHLMEIAQGQVAGAGREIPLFQEMRRRYDRGFWLRNAKRLLTGRLGRDDLYWDWKHRRASRADVHWYAHQFDHTRCPVRGEISPKYHQLGDAVVDAVAELFPQLRIVLLLRQPVDQIWSQARMVLARERGRAPEEVEPAAYRAFFDHWRKRNGDYVEIVDRWSRAFGQEQLLVAFYDELVGDPAALFGRVCAFLGVEPLQDAGVRRFVNRGQDAEIPPALREHLEAQWTPCIEGLVARYPALEHWLDR